MFKIALIGCLCISNVVVSHGWQFPTEPTTRYQNTNDPNFFDWTIFKTTLRNHKDINTNVLISPLLIKEMISLIADAAPVGTRTNNEITQLLPQYDNEFEQINYWERIWNSLNETSKNYAVEIASKNYIDGSITLTRRFEVIAKHKFNSDVESVNFQNSNDVVNRINNWVETKTKGHIKELVKEDTIKDALAVFLNAIYFQGTWQLPFNSNDTKIESFEVTQNKIIDASFMSQTNEFEWERSTEHEAEIVRLPYVGGKFSMYLLTSTWNGKLEDIIDKLDSEFIKQMKSRMTNDGNVRVSLPKFKFDYTANDLETNLEELGIKSIFSYGADLTGMTHSRRLHVSKILQKTGIVVDEVGTTAYASTVSEMMERMATPHLNFSKPFIFYIEDDTTGAILFAGKVSNPKF